MIDGPMLVRLFIGANVRKMANLDTLLANWERSFMINNDIGKVSTSALYYRFMHSILYDKMDMRIENNFVYFQTNRVMKMSLNQFADHDNALFLEKWFLIFGVRRVVDQAKGCSTTVSASSTI